MKKKITMMLAGAMLVSTLTGCSSYSKYVDLCDYEGVEATKVTFEVSDEDVQEEIAYLLYDYVTYEPVDRGAKKGDYVNITYTATVNGKEDEELSGEEEDIMLGEGYIFEEVEENLVGMKTGEKKTVEIVVPEDYEAAGSKAKIEVVVNEVTVEEIPEYNEAFVKEYTDFETMEEYEASVKETFVSDKTDEYKYVAVEDILSYLMENSKFDGYPTSLYEQCEEQYDANNEYFAQMYGMSLEDFTEMMGLDEETKKEEVEYMVNQEMVVRLIADKQKISVTEEEVKAEIEEIYEDYGYESVEDFLEDYSMEGMMFDMIYTEVCDYLYSKATFVEITEEEYLAQQEEMYEEGDAGEEDVSIEDAEWSEAEEIEVEEIEDGE